MTAAPLRARYDRDSDVLYLSSRPGVPARSREEQPGMVWRYDVEGGDLVGVTVIDFGTYWRRRRRELVEQIANRFHLSPEETRDMLGQFDE